MRLEKRERERERDANMIQLVLSRKGSRGSFIGLFLNYGKYFNLSIDFKFTNYMRI